MVKRTEIHIPINEITRVSFSCDECAAIITVDLAEENQRKGIPEKTNEKFCPICNTRLIRPVSDLLMTLMEVRRLAAAKDIEKNAFHMVLSESRNE
jgi:hypothetical protein